MSWTYQPDRLAKPRPRVLDKQDRRVKKESAYKENRQAALRRDSRRCRIYGSTGVETHHVVPRSLGGSHDVSNLLTLSAKAHAEFTAHILKIEGPTDANGKLRVLKYSDADKSYVLFQPEA